MSDDTQPVYQCLHNPLNRYITHNDLRKILQKAGVLEDITTPIEEFNLKNFQRAFTHISYTVHRDRKQGKNVIEKEDVGVIPEKCIPIQEDSMERLEWLGDSIIQSVVGI